MRRLPLALLPLLLLLLLLLLPLLLPLLLSLEGDKKRLIHVWTANDGTWPFTGKFLISTPRTGGSFSRKLPRRCVSPPSDATTAWQCFVWY